MIPAQPPPSVWRPLLERALAEDLGQAGDVTTESVVPPGARVRMQLVAREPGVACGVGISVATFTLLDDGVATETEVEDGKAVGAGETLAALSGPARPLLIGERVALNVLGRLCGIATRTAEVVAAVAGTGAAVAATRKTTPGLRALEKYAVQCGGGLPHRFGLYDGVLIKDNHVAVVGGVRRAVEAAKARAGRLMPVEVEVDSLEQLEEALTAGADAVLLDNMDPPTLRQAVEMNRGRAFLEASGGITLDNAVEVAATGVDVISLGWLTQGAPALDVAAEVETI